MIAIRKQYILLLCYKCKGFHDNEIRQSTFSRIPAAQPRAATILEFDWLNTKRSKSLGKQRAVCNSNSSRNSLRGT